MTSTEPLESPHRSGPSLGETLLVLAASLAPALAVPRLRIVSIVLPVVYLLVERRLRRRSWEETGFRWRTFIADLREQAWLVLLVGVILQALAILLTRFLLPEFRSHVIGRLPFDVRVHWLPLVPPLLIATFFEEVVYRATFQRGLALHLPTPLAIGGVSILFALMHFSPGPPAVVAVDLALIVVDSAIYGLIFARSGSVFVAWIAHALADLVGLALMLNMR